MTNRSETNKHNEMNCSTDQTNSIKTVTVMEFAPEEGASHVINASAVHNVDIQRGAPFNQCN